LHYLVASFSHKNCDIATREKIAFDDNAKLQTLQKITADHNINEAIILSTCNRVEIITSVKDCSAAEGTIFQALAEHSSLTLEELEGRADLYENEGAVHHIFSVTSALDSVVIGETQIAGQVKEAMNFACSQGFCGQKLNRVMQYAFKCAAEVRNKTEIARKPTSVASVAVDKAKKMLGSLSGITAVVVGAGEMGTLACKYLRANDANIILVARNIEKAQNVALEICEKIEVVHNSKLRELLNKHSLLFSATSASGAVITEDMIETLNSHRLWFDISVPRDIGLDSMENITVVTVDDLKDIVQSNIGQRADEAKIAYTIVGHWTIEFFKWINTLSVDPLIKSLREKAYQSSEMEISKAIKKGVFSKEQEEMLKMLMHSTFKKFLHEPTVNLKGLSSSPKLESVAEAIKYLFELGDEANVLDSYKLNEKAVNEIF
jgi:glutamyl-tRNA reductase